MDTEKVELTTKPQQQQYGCTNVTFFSQNIFQQEMIHNLLTENCELPCTSHEEMVDLCAAIYFPLCRRNSINDE